MLKILRRIIQKVASAKDFSTALKIAVKQISKALNTDSCSIFLLDKTKNEYVLAATIGLSEDAVGKARVPIDKSLVSLVGEREEPLNLDFAQKHPKYLSIPEVNEENYKAFLGAPIIYHRQVLGVLVVQQREPRFFDEAEESFLVTLSVQLAAVVAHAEAIGNVEKIFTAQESPSKSRVYSGIASSIGVGIGTGVIVYPLADLNAVPDRVPEDVEAEILLLESALAASREDFKSLGERLYPSLPLEERLLFDVYQRMLDSSDLGIEIIQEIRKGNWAQGALRKIIQKNSQTLKNIENEYLQERASDVEDLGKRVLSYLQKNERALPKYADKTILIGEELTAGDLAEVPEGCLVGVISAKGSSSSHIAILSRAMNVPTVMGVADIPIYEVQEQDIIVDGYYGKVYVEPSFNLKLEFKKLADEEIELDESIEFLRDQLSETKDGHRVSLLVNTGLGADMALALAAGAEGVGLYRTEAPFLVYDRFPSSEEQRVLYRQLLASFAPREVIMRTLDIGGDKELSYFPIKEENPFLGWRGIRITLDHPEIFLVQVRAMLKASVGLNNLKVMLPLISDVSEVDEAVRLIKKAYKEAKNEGLEVEMPKIGVMMEVPSAVYQARAIARRVDFLSAGSNDLTQYLLAVDRNNSKVANLYDPLHPAVLSALQQIVDAGHKEGNHVSICGEMAGNPVAILLLVAMGFDSLSMSAASISRMKWVISKFSFSKAKSLLKEVMLMESSLQIRQHMEHVLEQEGLGGLIRAGKN